MKIKISTSDGYRGVPGVKVGEYFAITPVSQHGLMVEYIVTHLPTGARVDWLMHREVAIAYCKALPSLGDWNFTNPEKIPPEIQKAFPDFAQEWQREDYAAFGDRFNLDEEQAFSYYYGDD
jgi:hypothetical protein